MAQNIDRSTELIEFARVLAQQTDYDEILRLAAQKSAQFLSADFALIIMVNPDTRQTAKTIMKNGRSIEENRYQEIRIHVGGWIISNKQSFFSGDIKRDKRFVKGLFDEFTADSAAGVPLLIEDIIIGALIIIFDDFPVLTEQELLSSLEDLAAVSVPFLRNSERIREYFFPAASESSLIVKYENAGLIGRSAKFIEMLHSIEAAAKCSTRVLLVGKTGTGKELIARAIHQYSTRSSGPFLAVDCGAIPSTLLESELFGHKRGAFTGAYSERSGIFLESRGGTLFMDEINNLPLETQSKFLRVIEDGQVRQLGSDKTVQTDARIITASSVPLKQLVENQQFREDLFYRLHVYPIYIPDLNERYEDVPLLANHFLKFYTKDQRKNIKQFHEDVTDFIRQRTWNGNIRELENFIERLVILASPETAVIDTGLFPSDLQEELKEYHQNKQTYSDTQPLRDKIKKYETQLIKEALIECNWNQSQAARRLQISEKNIRYRMELLGIQKP